MRGWLSNLGDMYRPVPREKPLPKPRKVVVEVVEPNPVFHAMEAFRHIDYGGMGVRWRAMAPRNHIGRKLKGIL